MIGQYCVYAGNLIAASIHISPKDASPPMITSVPTPTLRSDSSYDVTAEPLEVSDPDGDTYTCAEDPVVSVPFTVALTQVPNGE